MYFILQSNFYLLQKQYRINGFPKYKSLKCSVKSAFGQSVTDDRPFVIFNILENIQRFRVVD